jgi:hypothetical protein
MSLLLGAAFFIIHSSLFISCSSDDSDDPAIRVSETMTSYANVLKGAQNGWVMAFYGNTDYGGYNVLCKFEDNGKVTVANEKFGTDTTAVTHYKMEQSGGIVLSFDEYCEFIHYFSDPINPDGYGYGTANGFGGDLEFRVISASADSVILRGKKHGAHVKLTPVAQGTQWSDYLKGVEDVAHAMQGGYYHMINGTDSLRMRGDRHNRVFTYTTEDEEGESYTHTAPYIVTPQGITFYKPIEFAGQTVKGFDYQPQVTSYNQTGGGSVKFSKFVAPINEQLIDGEWYIKKENLGTFGNQRWNAFVTRMKSNFDLVIYYAVFGTFDSQFGLSVGCVESVDPSGVYLAECYYDFELSGEDKITLWANGDTDPYGNADYFLSNASMSYALQPFGSDAAHSRTFLIETDDVNNPTYLRLVDQNQSNNVITLIKEEVTYPFGEN